MVNRSRHGFTAMVGIVLHALFSVVYIIFGPVIPSSEATQADSGRSDLVTFVNRLCSHDVLLERGAL